MKCDYARISMNENAFDVIETEAWGMGGGACSSNRTSPLSTTATVCNKQPVRKRRAWMSQTVWRGAVYKVPCQWESTLLGNRSIWCHFLLRGDGEVACPAGRRAEKSVWELREQEAPDPLTDQNHTLMLFREWGVNKKCKKRWLEG